MNSSRPDQITVSRTVSTGSVSITETATATLPDELTLDDYTEALRRQLLADALFNALPSVASKRIPPSCKTPPIHSLN